MQSGTFKTQITNPDTVKTSIRYISSNIDNTKIEAFIEESQSLDIKNALGDNLYIDLMRYINKSENYVKNEYYDNLIAGGIYEYCSHSYEFSGLKKTLCYFVYARLVKHGDGVITRFGFVNKQDPNSAKSEFKEKLAEYTDAFRIAEEYMNECLNFIKRNKSNFPKWELHSIKPRRGPVFIKIGN